jgi:hypothetical protein
MKNINKNIIQINIKMANFVFNASKIQDPKSQNNAQIQYLIL